ncbi:hypothetical protein SAMN04488096_10143 [Mesonia phycicola]|uniref:DUF5018 domain-containing protein n=1 Tax=Mesonia phycicola TaxID=579105 RepID=A0A1M6A3G5_9FLAO|nr:hypothetical protein [Mesonia phycicola]SHI30899.1 hypothetical protein SAMN04488096_10143 [Mesonia phycicola]
MAPRIFLLLLLTFCFTSCSDDDESLSSKNQILSFSINDQNKIFDGEIDYSTLSIIVNMEDVDLNQPLTPIIKISNKATISPSMDISQVFKDDVKYTVTAENGIKSTYTVKAQSQNSNNFIESFKIKINDTIFNGIINEVESTITINTQGIEKNPSIIPIIEYSDDAKIFPSSEEAQNFNEPISYTVVAQNGARNNYKIIVNNNIILSSEKKIISYQLFYNNKIHNAIIDHENLTIDVETTQGIGQAKSTIILSDGATYTFEPGTNENFYLPITYKVTAEDGTSNNYIMTPKICMFNYNYSTYHLQYFANITPAFGSYNVDLNIPNSSLVLENNSNSYNLNYIDYLSQQSQYVDGIYTSFKLVFPQNIVSANNYKLKYKVNGNTLAETLDYLDVKSENAPIITSINQQSYDRGDTLIIKGENLPDYISIASNGYIYIITNSNNYDLTVNPERTELSLTLNYNFFPSYYGHSPSSQTITLIEASSLGYRRGVSVNAVFN